MNSKEVLFCRTPQEMLFCKMLVDSLSDPMIAATAILQLLHPKESADFDLWMVKAVSGGERTNRDVYQFLAPLFGADLLPDDIADNCNTSSMFRELIKAMVCKWLELPYTPVSQRL